MSKHNSGIVALPEVRLIEVLRYPKGTKLAGAVFLQGSNNDDTLHARSLFRNIEGLKVLCGDTTLKNVVIMAHYRDTDSSRQREMLDAGVSIHGRFAPVIHQGVQVHHRYKASDLGALRIILQGRPVIPKVQQETINEGSGPERIAPTMELRNEIPKLAGRQDSDCKRLEESMQEAMDKKVEELRRELEEQKRRAREEADGLRKRIAEMGREHRQELEEQERRAREEADVLRNSIAEMQSKLEEHRHRSGEASATRSVPPHLRAFLVGPYAHLALQRGYPSTDLRPSSPIISTTHFTARSMNDVCKTSRRVMSSGSLTIWTRHVTIPLFSLGAQAGQ